MNRSVQGKPRADAREPERDADEDLPQFDHSSGLGHRQEERDELWKDVHAFLLAAKAGVAESFGFDPRRSALYPRFPDLLRNACDPQVPILYTPKFREFGIMVLDGGTSVLELRFDPWSGRDLPPSTRDRWFEDLRRIGLDPDASAFEAPAAFRDESWWSERSAGEN